MSTVEMRTEVSTWLENMDDSFIAVVHAMVGTYVKQQEKKYETFDFSAEAYAASLEQPLTREDLVARAKASNDDIAAGRVYTREEAEKMLGL